MSKKTKQQGKAPVSRPLMQKVRIIGGQWKRTPLPVAVTPDLRPTPDRVRETVFNWLSYLCDGRWENIRCLDLFAGTGALGFEAASRGAADVTMVENHRPAFFQLQIIQEKLQARQVHLICQDAVKTAKQMAFHSEKFDLIFLDPPYNKDLLPEILPICEALLKEGGSVYLESNIPLDIKVENEVSDWISKWHVLREGRAGQVHYYLLQLKLKGNFVHNRGLINITGDEDGHSSLSGNI